MACKPSLPHKDSAGQQSQKLIWREQLRLFRALLYHLYLQPVELPPSALFLPLITRTWTPLNEMDYNFHKSNSTYFTDLDIARTHLVTAILRKGIRGIGKYPENAGNVGWSFANTTRAAGQPRGTGQKGRQDEGTIRDGEAKERSVGQEKEGGVEKASKVPFLRISALAGSGNTESGLNTPSRVATPQPGTPPHASSSLSAAAPAESSSASERRELTESEWWSVATKPGNLLIALGGNSCHYHREIPPYTRFEIWTRVLSWDRKWLYVVSHFVEEGAFRPKSYILQPRKGSRSKGWVGKQEGEVLSEEERRTKLRRKVYASSVSKYVVKKGRLTIPPELVLARSEMLPPRPAGAPSTFNTGYMPPKSEVQNVDNADGSSSVTLDVLEESLFPKDEEDGEWTWEKCETMRLRGLKLAQHFDALDGLREVFDGGERGAMGIYTDLVGGI